MIKGCQKKIIYMKSPDGGVFEEAYFILRPECDEKQLNERDMVKEATRIIDNATEGQKADLQPPKTQEKRHAFLLFIGGAAAASALFILIGIGAALL